jgi:hypothetical protein
MATTAAVTRGKSRLRRRPIIEFIEFIMKKVIEYVVVVVVVANAALS